jgi:hypothetical protein
MVKTAEFERDSQTRTGFNACSIAQQFLQKTMSKWQGPLEFQGTACNAAPAVVARGNLPLRDREESEVCEVRFVVTCRRYHGSCRREGAAGSIGIPIDLGVDQRRCLASMPVAKPDNPSCDEDRNARITPLCQVHGDLAVDLSSL